MSGDATDPAAAGSGAIPAPLASAAVSDVQTDVGPMFLHSADAVMRPALEADGRWEPPECAFLRAHLRPGSVFLDVGANVGYMTLLGARACGASGRVIAVEPEPRNVALLRANLWRNRLEATVLPAAAYSHHGFLHLALNETNPGDHQVHQEQGDTLVPCIRVDEHLGQIRVDVAKIDTQGTDHEVIAGMSGIVRRNPALLTLAEFWTEGMEQRGIDPLGVLAGYRSQGYRLGLLGDHGRARAATDAQITAACEAWAGRYVNVVLLGPSAPPPAGWRV
jgi:FkbM family methyltransferase